MGASIDNRDGRDEPIEGLSGQIPTDPEPGQTADSDRVVPPDAATGADLPLKSSSRQLVDLGEKPLESREGHAGVTVSMTRATWKANHHPVSAEKEEWPNLTQLGRYEIQRVLGQGGFGIVYLGIDPQLDRSVALKVPRPNRFADKGELDRFLVEARMAARLKHPLLVAIYDVQQMGDLPYIVQEYVESRNLADWCAATRPSFEQIARIMVNVAEAVDYIHQQGLIHCDLKAANILIDVHGHPHVTDFGLATQESAQNVSKGQRFGTPYAMAPEQIRGESHLMDGRTDIWALGVMLYQMLTGRLPFSAASREELFQVIRTHDPKPPRQVNRGVPREFERICLKCLSRRRADRYNTADDLREDLLNWLNHDPSSQLAPDAAPTAVRPPLSSKSDVLPNIVPKGLRAYDAEDADFFLALLPGPRDREGLPESVRFWRNRIAQRDPDHTFRVGLLYGPSGSGKSSLVKAGLLPRLSDDVMPIYIEATLDATEDRLLMKLRTQFPFLPVDASLPQVCAELRKCKGTNPRKILLVIDQFEQWLHANPLPKDSQLVDALRQCDGGNLQAVLMVRDDFFLSVNRVFQELEVRLIEGLNCSMIDLCDFDHSQKVLTLLGRAYGKLGEPITPMQEKFLSRAVNDLAENGKVICVQLALFADMMKSRAWIPASLQLVGGVEGVGVAMLEETFNSQTAPLSYRIHEDAIRRVLKAMLPSSGTDIKGAAQWVDHLREVAGYADKPREFDQLIGILDNERRLITPTDNAAVNPADKNSPPARSYQLTHDYLVPSLRTWLTRKQTERLQGRAELRLSDIAADWGAKLENKRLPATWEYVVIRLLTDSGSWKPNERKLMEAAARFHRKRWVTTVAVTAILGAVIWAFISDHTNRIKQERNDNSRRRAELLVTAALNAPASAVPYAAQNVEPSREYALPILRQRFDEKSTDPAQRLRAAVLLTQMGEPRNEYLIAQIEAADKHECPNVVAALERYRESVLGPFHQLIGRAESQQNWRLKARLAITLLELGDNATALQMLHLDSDPIQRVTFIDSVPQWHGSVQRLLESLDQTDSGSFRSGIVLGIGAIPLDELLPAELEAVAVKLAGFYRDTPDAGTHSAAGWVLRRWKRPLPAVPSNAIRDWKVNSIGMTMVKVPPTDGAPAIGRQGSEKSNGAQKPGFWLSDCETAIRFFQTFMDDPSWPQVIKLHGVDVNMKPANNWKGSDPERSPSPDHPVQRVSWIDAVLFCNWLSHREHRDACYVWDGKAWQLVPGAKGYRLPTEAEWESACRAGTTTEFVCGNDDRFLEQYAAYRANQTAVCGSKMPNPWGLFDLHGNVYEWCQDWYAEDESKVLRSGAFEYNSTKSRSSNRQQNKITYRSFTVGIRVARNAD
jgi:serine/threonine protein kinase/formylglycine-generating enzyme required for sulfatase activity